MKQIVAYHGTSHQSYEQSPLRPPFFVTTQKDAAEFYADNQVEPGHVLEGVLRIKNPLDIRFDYDLLFDMIKLSNIPFTERPYFDCPTISQHCHYDGSNSADVVYIPEFQKTLIKQGYDSVHLNDALGNQELDTYILFSSDQFVIKSNASKPKRSLK